MGGEEEEEGIWAERKNTKGINKATIVALRGHRGGKLMMGSEFGRLKDDPASTGINLAVKNGEECAGKEGWRKDGWGDSDWRFPSRFGRRRDRKE